MLLFPRGNDIYDEGVSQMLGCVSVSVYLCVCGSVLEGEVIHIQKSIQRFRQWVSGLHTKQGT